MVLNLGIRNCDFSASSLSYLKRDLILFDQIAIPKLGFVIQAYGDRYDSDKIHIANELEWLASNSAIVDTKEVKEKIDLTPFDEKEILEFMLKFHQSLEFLLPNNLSFSSTEKNIIDSEVKKKRSIAIDTLKNKFEFDVRIDATHINKAPNIKAIPLLSYRPQHFGFIGEPKLDIAQIVIREFCHPLEDTPWEQILDFVNDPEVKPKRDRLHRWFRRVATSDLSIERIEDELFENLFSYEEYMKLHQIKYERGILGTLILTTTEALENIIKLNFSKAAKALLTIGRDRIQLLDAELKAPGRELSFISHAKTFFGMDK